MNKLSSLVVGFGLVLSSLLHPVATYHKLTAEPAQQSLGAASTSFTPVQARSSTLSGSGATAGATTLNLTAFVTPGGTPITMANFGNIGYVTIEPGTSKEENTSFTGITQNANGTAQLTGVSRGLSFTYPYAASSTLAKAHAGGSVVVTSNSAPFYSQFAFQLQDANITGVYTFSTSSIPRLNGDYVYTTGDERKLVTYGQLASTTFAGTVNGSFTQKGIFQLATTSQLIAGTASGSSGALLVPANSYFNTTSSASNLVPVTGSGGKLSSGFIDQTVPYTWTAAHSFASTTTFTASSTITANGTSTFNGSLFAASTTFSQIPTATTTAPTLSNQIIVKNYADTAYRTTSSVSSASIAVGTKGATTTINVGLGGAVLQTCTISQSSDSQTHTYTLFQDSTSDNAVTLPASANYNGIVLQELWTGVTNASHSFKVSHTSSGSNTGSLYCVAISLP